MPNGVDNRNALNEMFQVIYQNHYFQFFILVAFASFSYTDFSFLHYIVYIHYFIVHVFFTLSLNSQTHTFSQLFPTSSSCVPYFGGINLRFCTRRNDYHFGLFTLFYHCYCCEFVDDVYIEITSDTSDSLNAMLDITRSKHNVKTKQQERQRQRITKEEINKCEP